MSQNQCEYCMYLDEDPETGEFFCSMNMDQDDLEKLRFDTSVACPLFRMGDDYTIVKKQGS